MNLWKSLAGMVEVELTSAEPESALGAINGIGVELSHVMRQGDLTFRFRIRRRDYRIVAGLCRKRGERLETIRKLGLYWTGRRLLGRPVLLVGMVLFLVMVLYLPSRVFFVRVEGNLTVPDKRILEAAEASGICFGASRRQVRSEKVKNDLLSAVPQLQWAGVNTSGCVATISVRERSDSHEKSQMREVSSIVAARDGYILSGTVTSGNALFKIGQTVREGQTLISGYTDCGICIQATRAEGEIFAQTNRELEAILPAEWTSRGEMVEIKRSYSLLLGKKRINLWKDSGILDPGCGRMYTEYYAALPGGFRLPIALCIEEYTCYENQSQELTQEEAEGALSEFAKAYLPEHMVAGKVLHESQEVVLEDGIYRLRGTYVCAEMIGREQREQIGDTNG